MEQQILCENKLFILFKNRINVWGNDTNTSVKIMFCLNYVLTCSKQSLQQRV